jgi:hypothetical protein
LQPELQVLQLEAHESQEVSQEKRRENNRFNSPSRGHLHSPQLSQLLQPLLSQHGVVGQAFVSQQVLGHGVGQHFGAHGAGASQATQWGFLTHTSSQVCTGTFLHTTHGTISVVVYGTLQ